MFVYVIGTGKGPVKIGYARDPEDRMAKLQIGTPERLILFRKVPHQRAQVVERKVHKRLKQHRQAGEWFYVSIDLAIEVVDEEAAALPEMPRHDPLQTGLTIINVKGVSVRAWECARVAAAMSGETMGAYLSRALWHLAESEAAVSKSRDTPHTAWPALPPRAGDDPQSVSEAA